jgi:hypothetical protein
MEHAPVAAHGRVAIAAMLIIVHTIESQHILPRKFPSTMAGEPLPDI